MAKPLSTSTVDADLQSAEKRVAADADTAILVPAGSAGLRLLNLLERLDRKTRSAGSSQEKIGPETTRLQPRIRGL